MIPRYSCPEMRAIWTLEHKFRTWLEIEILATEAQVELGIVPKEALAEIREKASFNVGRIEEIEHQTNHDVIAFLTNVAENVGDASKWIHHGMTSSDIVDTALSVQMKNAADILIVGCTGLVALLREKALHYRDTVMVGRTHGIHAEPMTFGMKLGGWAFEMKRNVERLEAARSSIAVGKISGAVGTYSNIDPFVEEYVCRRLGLARAPVSTQVLSRDRHAQFMTTLAVVAASLEKFATEIRNLQRTDIHEAEEPFAVGQKGSSAMPHKRNPIISERIVGLARVIKGNAVAALDDVALWHERDISHSSTERVIIPDSCLALDYIIGKFRGVIRGLIVYPEDMQRNLDKTKGLIFSSRVLLALVGKEMLREDAYEVVQRASMRVWDGDGTLQELLEQDPEVSSRLPKEELDELFDVAYFLRHVDEVFKRVEELEV
jgi:adenylosuccinate lyase